MRVESEEVPKGLYGNDGDGVLNDLAGYVDGFAAYLVAEYGMFSVGVEYMSGLDDFRPGEMAMP